MKKVLSLLLALVFVFSLTEIFVLAEGESLALSTPYPALTDGRESRPVTVKESFTLSAEKEMDSIYLIFHTKPISLTLTAGDQTKTFSASFLRQYISITDLFDAPQKEITLSFEGEATFLEIYGFSGAVPSWVQIWKEPAEKADLCLMTTHADDEQLFFAGILPYYAGEKKLSVQVIYFTDHQNEPMRRHELLQGLWTVGVTHYPVIGPFPDLYSKSEDAAMQQLSGRGYSYEDVVGFQVEMLRRFRPLVVVGHDPLGEYGHGQHILNSHTLRDAVLQAGSEEAFPESRALYGTYEVPKTYLHLYSENQITLDWDTPLQSFDGKTAFEVTKLGFACHDSQQYTWFRRWLNGENGEIKKSTQIRNYSPNSYGLFRSLVGEDVEKNDFFENQLSYEEMRIIEEEERARIEAEEKAKAEKERLEKEARDRREKEALRLRKEREKKERERNILIVISILFFAISMVMFYIYGKNKKVK